MRQIKKTLSIFMAALFVMAGVLGNVTAKAAVTVLPEVTFIGVEHSPLVVGDTETFTVTSKYEGLVQYRAFLYTEKTNKWAELTTGYTVAADAKTVVSLPKTSAFELGKYKLSVWVKKAGTTGIKTTALGSYDNYLVSNVNCVSRDDANRVYANGVMDVKQEGLKVTINNSDFKGLTGIEGPYKLKLHYFNPTTSTWTKDATVYGDKIEYTFPKAGTYVLDVHVNTLKSTTWAKGGYEAWKLKTITVTDNATVKVFNTTVAAATFGSNVNVTMTAEGTKEFPTATQYQIFNGTSAISSPFALGTATTVFPAKVAGDKVNVKLMNAAGVEVKTIEVLLGQSGTITIAPPVVSVVSATVKTLTFGSAVDVTTNQVGAVKYQVLNGTAAISGVTALGTPAMVFPGKVAGDKVNVKLINAADAVISTTEVVLVAAK
jgi:hypothetical protein